MPRRPEAPFPASNSDVNNYSSLHFVDEQKDAEIYQNFTFSFCTFEKIGLKSAKFIHCTFRHCEFIDCYLAHAEFEHCRFTGSFFDRCVFSWATFPNSGLDYTNFSNCGPVLSQVINHKPTDPQAAAKFFRNLASEHGKLGNWEQVDKCLVQAYRERERHSWYVISRRNDHYKTRYSGSARLEHFGRYIGSKLAGMLIGYGISWPIFLRTILLFGMIIFPVVNAVLGRHPGIADGNDVVDVVSVPTYVGDLYSTTIRAVFPFIPSTSQSSNFIIPFWLTSVEAAFGTTMMAVFAALLFRWASKGT